MNAWHKQNGVPITSADESFYEGISNEINRIDSAVSSDQKQREIEAKLKDLRKHDEYLTSWDFDGSITGNKWTFWDKIQYAFRLQW